MHLYHVLSDNRIVHRKDITMPYEGPDDAGLPDRIKKMSKPSREKWVGVWNDSFKNCRDTSKAGGGGTVADCEGTAFRFANAAVKEGVAGKCYEACVREISPWEQESLDFAWAVQMRRVDQEQAAYNPLGGTDTMACANCQFFISPDDCAVVVNYSDAISPTGLSKFWTERVKYERKPMEVVIVEGESEMAEKQVTKTDGGIEFQASDYAVVPDAEKPSTWKLRLAEERSSNFTVAQVARAITAMQPSGFRGQRVQLSADGKKQAISRISAAIGKTGGDDTQKENLRERLDKVKEKTIIGKAVDAIKDLFSDKPEIEHSGFKLYKQADGSYRWVATVSNHFRDKDNPPEIFEAKAHREFISHLDNGGEFPETWLWHTPGTKWGKADWADFVDGFLVMSGTVDDTKEAIAIAESLVVCEGLKVSHGYKHRYSDQEKGIIGFYRTFEISPLPAEVAANPWTSMVVLKKEAEMGFSEKKREFLVTHLGEDKVVELEGDTAGMAKALEALGIEYKETEEDPTETLADVLVKALGGVDTDQMALAAAKVVVESEGFKTIMTTMAELKAVTDQLPAILVRLKELEKTEDEKIAKALTAKVTAGATSGFRASEDAKTVVKDGDKTAEGGPMGPDAWSEKFSTIALGGVPQDGARAS